MSTFKIIKLVELRQNVGTVSREEFRSLVEHLITLQNVAVRIMDTMDANQQIANDNATVSSQNFVNMLAALKVVADTVGIEIRGVNTAVAEQVDTAAERMTEPDVPEEQPDNVKKHLH